MKEIQYIKYNKKRWDSYQKKIQKNRVDNPDEYAEMYILLNDDLAKAKSNYPSSNIIPFLNGLISDIHSNIYKNKKEKSSRFLTFWKYEVPLAIWENRLTLFTAFFIFSFFVFIGAYSAAMDGDYVRLILGDSYVNQTIQNIEEGNPTAIYGGHDASSSFLGITFNNIRVSFYAFCFGITAGLGTVYVLIQNGIMLGSFQYFFYDYEVLGASAKAIWMHGTIEITSIVLAGGAGLILGKGIIFPGTYSRIESVKKAAKTGSKIIIGLVPFFILAGFIEGYFTRYAQENNLLAYGIISGSILLILYYFIYLPFKLYHK